MRIPLHHITLVGSALTLAVVVVLAGAGIAAHDQAIALAQAATRTREITTDLQRLLTLAVDDETAMRGFALSGADDFLEPRLTTAAVLPEILVRLRQLTADRPPQQERLGRITRLLEEKAALSQRTIDLRRSAGLEAAAAQVATRAGKLAMDALREELDACLEDERAVADQRQAEGLAAGRRTVAILVGGLTVQVLLVAAGGGILIRAQRRRQHAAEDLARLAALQRVLLDTAPVGIIACTADGVIASFSPGAERLLGHRAADLVGRQTPALFHDADEVAARAAQWSTPGRPLAAGFAVFRHQAERLGTRPVEWTFVREDGTRFAGLLALSPLPAVAPGHGPAGAAAALSPAYLGVVTDIGERKRAELALLAKSAELERSNHELQQFAYVASHDLQEPLRMVGSYTGLLARRYGDQLDADAREFIAFAKDGALRMQVLIDDLLAFARIGHHAPPLGPVDSGTCMDRALAHLGPAITESGATIERAPLPTVIGDPGQLVQLFQNLVGNALKYRAPGVSPVVRIAATARGAQQAISIADNGIGIAPEFQERIFGLFQRLHSRAEYGGTGIGLAICRKIAERHGGAIQVTSAPGIGSTFTVLLPAPAPARESGARSSSYRQPPTEPA